MFGTVQSDLRVEDGTGRLNNKGKEFWDSLLEEKKQGKTVYIIGRDCYDNSCKGYNGQRFILKVGRNYVETHLSHLGTMPTSYTKYLQTNCEIVGICKNQ